MANFPLTGDAVSYLFTSIFRGDVSLALHEVKMEIGWHISGKGDSVLHIGQTRVLYHFPYRGTKN